VGFIARFGPLGRVLAPDRIAFNAACHVDGVADHRNLTLSGVANLWIVPASIEASSPTWARSRCQGDTTMFRNPRLLLAVAMSFAASGAMAQTAAKPTDPQIAHIAYTAGQLDIAAAELALKTSQNKAVREFAEEMVRDHTAVNKQALALARRAPLRS
jgi:hypothetical protein